MLKEYRQEEPPIEDITLLVLYGENGVKEYWVVYPGEKVVEIFNLSESDKYERPAVFAGEDIITSQVLSGMQIKLNAIFEGY